MMVRLHHTIATPSARQSLTPTLGSPSERCKYTVLGVSPCASMHICVEPPDWRCGMETDCRGEGCHRVYRELRYAFGRQVLTLRTRVALTQSALAAAVCVHPRSVQNWETGESYLKAET